MELSDSSPLQSYTTPFSVQQMLKNQTFAFFSSLPSEIRIYIWEQAVVPRIVRWTRTESGDEYLAAVRTPPLFSVCRECRAAILAYGKYQLLGAEFTPLYFSPVIDILWLNAGWIDPNARPTPVRNFRMPTNFIPPPTPRPHPKLLPEEMDSQLRVLRYIMVHPNFSGEHRRPTTMFGELKALKRILVASDEKTIEFRSNFLVQTLRDIRVYYATLQGDDPDIRVPEIAVGCLALKPEDKQLARYGTTDNRQLVAVLKNEREMNAYLMSMKREEPSQSRQPYQPKIAHVLRQLREAGSSSGEASEVREAREAREEREAREKKEANEAREARDSPPSYSPPPYSAASTGTSNPTRKAVRGRIETQDAEAQAVSRTSQSEHTELEESINGLSLSNKALEIEK